MLRVHELAKTPKLPTSCPANLIYADEKTRWLYAQLAKINKGMLEIVRKNTFSRAEGSTHLLPVLIGTGLDTPKDFKP